MKWSATLFAFPLAVAPLTLLLAACGNPGLGISPGGDGGGRIDGASDGSMSHASGRTDGGKSRDASADTMSLVVNGDGGSSTSGGQCVPKTCSELRRELRPHGRRLRRRHPVRQLHRAGDVRRGRKAQQLWRQQQLRAEDLRGPGANCGPMGDGCGGVVQCGSCTAPKTCGGGGMPSVCGGDSGCAPKTCASAGVNCGPIGDGCGNVRGVRQLRLARDLRWRRYAERLRGWSEGRRRGRRQQLRAEDVREPGLQLRPGRRWLRQSAELREHVRGAGDLRRRRGPGRLRRELRLRATDVRKSRDQLRSRGRRLRRRARVRGHVHRAPDVRRRRYAGRVRGNEQLRTDDLRGARLQLRPGRRWLRGLLECGSSCTTGQICGGGGHPGVCGPTAGSGTGCTGLCLEQVACAAPGVTTTISGTVYAPNGTDPLYDALVYVPNGSAGAPTYGVTPFPPGVACGQCGSDVSGSPLVSTNTAPDGTFELQNVPVGTNIPLVIQLGRWRRKITIPSVASCVNTALTPAQTSLPSEEAQFDPADNIPLMAFSTGSVDGLECVLLKIGINQNQFSNPATQGGSGRVRFYTGEGGAGAQISAATPSATQLWSGATPDIDQYDMVFFPCQGGEYTKTAAEQTVVVNYANAGGRVFGTHFSYAGSSIRPRSARRTRFLATATWQPNQTISR